ncbi:hypothetical protein PSQ40_09060 [Curvibacter sp. HBC61]|uniref:Uncharacterized protein n=1 Tax=Curvibacter cyanobacteriorum TaxID=3026422 RepID=A0ABT5MXH8_9BURK|nr:hypothetical protein [Curvibacter sp. HBC61]MDD0838720.1 hypothetical protein [Curvibacter sp. HBC61]
MPSKSHIHPPETRSQRLIDRLKQLRQFQPAQEREMAIHVLSGVVVTALPDPAHEGHGLLQLRLPHGLTEAVMGDAYLALQLIEHCRLEHDGPDGDSPVARRVQAWAKKWSDLDELG